MNLQNKVTEIKGIGPRKSVALHKINIEFIEDFLFFYPRDYEAGGQRSDYAKIQ